MGCRRLLGALCRAVIMAGFEAGLSQGRTPRRISAPLARAGGYARNPQRAGANHPLLGCD